MFSDIKECKEKVFIDIISGLFDKETAIVPTATCLAEKGIDCMFEGEVFKQFDQCVDGTSMMELPDDASSLDAFNSCMVSLGLNECKKLQ